MMKCCLIVLVLSFTAVIYSCRQLLEVDPPQTLISAQRLSQNPHLLESALLNAYAAFDFEPQNTHFLGLYADELLTSSTTITAADEYMASALNPQTNPGNYTVWKTLYSVIYQANAVLEATEASGYPAGQNKETLAGQARFLRAFSLFYLVNIWGDVPLPLSTGIKQPADITRAPAAEVYQQIFDDLQYAQSVLPSLTQAGSKKTRASREAATALLARVYLYSKHWVQAERMASEIIESGQFTTGQALPAEMAIFRADSREAIFQLWNLNGYSQIGNTFIPASATSTPSYYLTPDLLSLFEAGDLRRSQWLGVGAESVYYPLKYQSRTTLEAKEYSTFLRAAELFLIRAEASFMQGKLSECVSDVNIVRSRAALPPLSLDGNADSIQQALENERQRELFCENGHRFFDLKRTGKIDSVMSALKPTWRAGVAAFFPIPSEELKLIPSMPQNPGYN